MHHAGLVEKDRQVVEELFVNQKIQILIATATVAWGVNFPGNILISGYFIFKNVFFITRIFFLSKNVY